MPRNDQTPNKTNSKKKSHAQEQAFLGVMTKRRYFLVCSFLCSLILSYAFQKAPLATNNLQNKHNPDNLGVTQTLDDIVMHYYGDTDLIFSLFTHPESLHSLRTMTTTVPPILARPVLSQFSWTDGMIWNDNIQKLIFTDPHLNKIYTFDQKNLLNIVSNDCGDTKNIETSLLSELFEPGCNSIVIDNSNSNTYISQFGTKNIILLDDSNNNGQNSNNLSAIYENEQINNFNIDNNDFMTVLDSLGHKTVVNGYNGKLFNGPAHLLIHNDGYLYFSDPQYGLAYKNGSFETSQIGFYGVYRLSLNDKSKKNNKNSKNSEKNSVELIEDKIESPNGIVFNPNGNYMYVSNCLEGKFEIWVYRVVNSNENRFEFVTKWNEQNQNIENFEILKSHSSFKNSKNKDSSEIGGCVDGFLMEQWPNKLKNNRNSRNSNSAMMIATCPGGQLCILEVNDDKAIMRSVIKFAKGAVLSGVINAGDGYVYVSGLGRVWAMLRNEDVW